MIKRVFYFIRLIFLQGKMTSFRFSKLFGSVAEIGCDQEENVLPIVLVLLGIVIETRDEQGESIPSPIVVAMFETMVSVVGDHLENVFLSMAIKSKSAINSRKQHE